MTAAVMLWCQSVSAQRRITPVNTQATATQPINEFEGDSTRIRERMLQGMKHYHDEQGNIIYIDTITGREWRDSTNLNAHVPMRYPLWHRLSVGVDIWNPIMRVFGQKYGLIDVQAQLSLHNRYKPVFETGLGLASNTPSGNNFTYKSPLSWYMRLGCDYNFLYNSNPDYQYTAGLRYGLSPFSFDIRDISIGSSYWDETAHPVIPSQHAFVGWIEVTMGLKVKISGPWYAGWTLRYHSILHQSHPRYGMPWYIPGYGTRSSSLSGSITISYMIDLNKSVAPAVNQSSPEILVPTPETDDPYAPGITSPSSMQRQAQPVISND